MIDTIHEQLIAIEEAPDYLPHVSRGRKIHWKTAYRWAKHGLKGIKLETVRVGGRRYTSSEAICRFIHSLTRVTDNPNHPYTNAKAVDVLEVKYRTRSEVSECIKGILGQHTSQNAHGRRTGHGSSHLADHQGVPE